MASDRVLIDATNETFWQLTNYKRGQRLDMSIPQDRQMANVWNDIYRQIAEHRTRATQAAMNVARDRRIPYVVVVEQKTPEQQFGYLASSVHETRNAADVQYAWAIDQPDRYTYLAEYDFTAVPNAPIRDQFALIRRLQSGSFTSGWPYGWRY